jgi:hypothetical protein
MYVFVRKWSRTPLLPKVSGGVVGSAWGKDLAMEMRIRGQWQRGRQRMKREA